MSKKIHLDEFEQDIEDNLESSHPILNMEAEMAVMKKTASLHAKRKKSITLRVYETDLEIMKIKASKLGIPYQTYINMLIHRDSTSEQKW